MNNDEEDEIVSRMPVRLSHGLGEKIHIHQYPLLLRPLQVPPSAAASGKRISARIKPKTRRIEVHVPADTRTDVWNAEKGQMLGMAQVEDDEEKNQTAKVKLKEGEEPRLSHVRMRSEEVPQRGAYMLGVVHNGAANYLNLCYWSMLNMGCRTATPTSSLTDTSIPTYTHLSRCPFPQIPP